MRVSVPCCEAACSAHSSVYACSYVLFRLVFCVLLLLGPCVCACTNARGGFCVRTCGLSCDMPRVRACSYVCRFGVCVCVFWCPPPSFFLCFPSSPSRIVGHQSEARGIEEGSEGWRRRSGGKELAGCQGRGAGTLPRGEREERENRRVEGDSGREKQGREMEQEGERNERE